MSGAAASPSEVSRTGAGEGPSGRSPVPSRESHRGGSRSPRKSGRGSSTGGKEVPPGGNPSPRRGSAVPPQPPSPAASAGYPSSARSSGADGGRGTLSTGAAAAGGGRADPGAAPSAAAASVREQFGVRPPGEAEPVPDDAAGASAAQAEEGALSPQEELNFQWVLARMRSLNDLNPPPPKVSRKLLPGISRYVASQQPSGITRELPRSAMVGSLVNDANAKLSLDRGCFREARKTKALLPLPLPKQKKYYLLQGVSTGASTVNDSMADLLKSSLDSAAKKDVVLSSADAKELESGASFACNASSWLDHWFTAFGRLALDPTRDEATIRRMLTSGGMGLSYISDMVNTLWFNLRLKRRDAVLGAVHSECSPEDLSMLRNGSFDDSGRLFPEEAVRDVIEASRSRVNAAAMRRAAQPGGSGKRQLPTQQGHGSSGSGPSQAKTQKSSGGASGAGNPAPGKGSDQPFQRQSGRKGKRRGRDKKRGGTT